VAEHVRVRPGDPDAGLVGEAAEPPGGGVAVHPGAAAAEQNRAAGAVPIARSITRPTAGGSGTRTIL